MRLSFHSLLTLSLSLFDLITIMVLFLSLSCLWTHFPKEKEGRGEEIELTRDKTTLTIKDENGKKEEERGALIWDSFSLLVPSDNVVFSEEVEEKKKKMSLFFSFLPPRLR